MSQNKNWSLEQTLLQLPDKSHFTIGNAVEGVAVFGGIGSGKTSGSARMLALKYLQAGMGGLVLTVKTDEKEQWVNYCKEAGRFNDLIIIEPEGKHRFNFLEYETRVKERTYSTNVVGILNTVIKASRNDDNGGNDDAFWRDALTLTISNAVDLCILAYDTVTVQDLYDIFMTSPKKEEEKKETDKVADKPVTAFMKAFRMAQYKVNKEVEAWERMMPEGWIENMEKLGLADEARMKAVPVSRKLISVYSFFMEKYKSLADRTKAIIDFKFMGFLYRLLQEPVYSMFCDGVSTVTPDDSLNGKIILLDLPVKVYDQVGKDAQILFKYIWQRAMERRNVKENDRPVFLFTDEAQHLLVGNDTLFQTTCRSSLIASVYITQNISNYYAHMGGSGSEHHVQSFLGTLATKLFHANSHVETNRFASDLIGEHWVEDIGTSQSLIGDPNLSNSTSYKLQKHVRPEEFVSLSTGGKSCNFLTAAYMHRQGKTFNNEENYQRISFDQHFHL